MRLNAIRPWFAILAVFASMTVCANAQAPDFSLDYLPPYSPDLNPIERVWKLTRRLCLHDRYFPTLDSVIVAAEKEFSPWARGSATLKRLCALS